MGGKADGLGFIFQLYLSITKGHMGLSAGKRFSSVIKCKIQYLPYRFANSKQTNKTSSSDLSRQLSPSRAELRLLEARNMSRSRGETQGL